MRTLLLFVALLFTGSIFGQEDQVHRNGFTFKAGTRYFGWTDVSIPNPEYSDEEIIFSEDGQYGKSLRLYAGYFVSQKLSLNLGFGLDRYEGNGANTAPLVIQTNYYLSSDKKSFFASAEVGTQIAFSETLDKGFVYALMLGKEFSFSDKTGLNVYLGYNFQRSKYEHENKHPDLIYLDKLNRKSLIIGVDFVIF